MKRYSRGPSEPPRAEANPNQNPTTTKQTQEKMEEQKGSLRKRLDGGNKLKSPEIMKKEPELTPPAAGGLHFTSRCPSSAGFRTGEAVLALSTGKLPSLLSRCFHRVWKQPSGNTPPPGILPLPPERNSSA